LALPHDRENRPHHHVGCELVQDDLSGRNGMFAGGVLSDGNGSRLPGSLPVPLVDRQMSGNEVTDKRTLSCRPQRQA
jgi:hypothetical protein